MCATVACVALERRKERRRVAVARRGVAVSHKDGRVVLSAWVDPALRDYAREAARLSGLEFSHWVARAVRQTMEADERLRAVRKLLEENGCECPCDHHWEERGPDCEICLACLIGEAVGK